MISAIVPTSAAVFAVSAGPKGEVVFSRVQCWAVTDIVQKEGNQMILAGRAVTGVALLNGQLAPCNGVNVVEFVGYDETPPLTYAREHNATGPDAPSLMVPDPAPWVEKCAERRKRIDEEKAKAKQSKIVLPGGAGLDPTWNQSKDLKALRSDENPLN